MKNRSFLKLTSLMAAMTIAVLPATSQQTKAPAPAANPTFSARTELVLVPAIVTDHHGHVSGLTKDDFIVQENGVEQKLATFEEVKPSAQRILRVSTAGQREYSNTHFTDYAPRRINIIVLDTINTKIFDQQHAKQDLVKYLASSVTAQDLTSLLVMTRGGVRVVHDFTSDPNVLVRALQRVKGQVDMMAGTNTDVGSADDSQAGSEATDLLSLIDQAEAQLAQQMQENAIDATIDGFEAIASAFSGIPGRKSLVWISGAFPLRFTQPGDIIGSRFQDRYERLFEKLNHANIAIYPVDARGLVVTALTASDSMMAPSGRMMNPTAVQRGRSVQNQQTIDTLNAVADMTGGRAFYNTNDLTHALQRAAEDSSSYYLLGYYVKSDAGKPGWRKLSVKVRRGGMQVRARSGYLATPDHETDPDVLRRRDINEALSSPFEFTAVPMTVRIAGQKAGEQNKHDVYFDILLPPNSLQIDTADQNHMNFQFVALARDGAGRDAGDSDQRIDGHLKPDTMQKLAATGIAYRGHVSVTPGEYNMKVVVRDNVSGRVGSVSVPISVQ